MIELKDVKNWAIEEGIGHILLWAGDGRMRTACGWVFFGGGIHKTLPKRICRKCRATMPQITHYAKTK